ncbi:glycogenin-1-like [Apostichopus japonicus]|uniref:glycogenin-1-like n=1 Tax=Stichopus japonicus TaxID=307972 RepID=UPI003AB3CE9D
MSSEANPDREAFVTLATNDPYAYGALILGQSLRNVKTTRKLAVLVTSQVTQPLRRQLNLVFDHIQQVDPLDSQDAAHLTLLARPELGITFSKLHCWTLTQYSKCVFLDADCLVLRNVDDLFEREELSAAPDVGWPDCFNSGVFVFRPSLETHKELIQCALTLGSFDGGDQGLLNTFFKDWPTKDMNRHLPFIYNMTSSMSYSYLPAYLFFRHDIRIVHFIGLGKPWLYTYHVRNGHLQPPQGLTSHHDEEFVKKWWSIFVSHIKPRLEQESGSLLYELNLVDGSTIDASSPRARQHAWERGEIDYLGKDGFDFILDQICTVIEGNDIKEEKDEQTPSSSGDSDSKLNDENRMGGNQDKTSPTEVKETEEDAGASPNGENDSPAENNGKGEPGGEMEIDDRPTDDQTKSKCPCVIQ